MLTLVIKDSPDKEQAMESMKKALEGTEDVIISDEPKGTNRFMVILGKFATSNAETDITYEVSYNDLILI